MVKNLANILSAKASRQSNVKVPYFCQLATHCAFYDRDKDTDLAQCVRETVLDTQRLKSGRLICVGVENQQLERRFILIYLCLDDHHLRHYESLSPSGEGLAMPKNDFHFFALSSNMHSGMLVEPTIQNLLLLVSNLYCNPHER